MSQVKLRIHYLESAAKGINLAKVESHSSINDALASLRDDGYIRFKPDNVVSARMEIEITDAGLKRLDELKRSRYPGWLTFGIPAVVIALVALAYEIITG